jgi:hypothetical protein
MITKEMIRIKKESSNLLLAGWLGRPTRAQNQRGVFGGQEYGIGPALVLQFESKTTSL